MKKCNPFSKIITGIFLLMMNSNLVFGNAIALSAIAVNQAASTVTFTITWDNSWRIAAGTPPYNWDATWVFVKFRDCSTDPVTTQFTHADISTTVTDHNFDGNGDGAQLEPTTSNGVTIPGIDTDGKGVMLRRTSDGSGTVTETVRLKITTAAFASGTLDVRVFAIEMVFCTGGASVGGLGHYIGDGNGTTSSYASFATGACTNNTAMQITSENAVTVYIDPSSNCGSRAITANFQKGYAPFYIMKYEISQGQYTDFLNTLSGNQANTRYPGSYNSYRHRIQFTVNPPPNAYSCDRPDRACNFIGWADVSAYCDWAAMRPLTELEYEKAGRGFSAKSNFEYAWGNTIITAAVTISGAENGTETITTAGANVCAGNNTFTGGDGGTGPLRCGIFAKAGTTTRQETGGSYFGVLDLSGNVEELYIASPCGVSGQPCAGGVGWGDGSLSAGGNHNVASWPAYNAIDNVDRRGGSWSTTTTNGTGGTSTLQLSNRNSMVGGSWYGMAQILARNEVVGGRGGR